MILFFPFDLLSHNLRCLQLAKSIKEEYDVRFAHSPAYESYIHKAGFKTFSYQGLPVEIVMAASKRFEFSWIQEPLLEKTFLEQVKVIELYKPQVIVGDASFTLRLAAVYCKIPYISIINGYMSPYYKEQRRLPPSHPIVKSTRSTPPAIFNFIAKHAEKFMLGHVQKPFRRLANKYNLEPKQDLLRELEGDVTLIADVEALFPQEKLPSTYNVIGALYHKTTYYDEDIANKLENGRKNIYATIGSTGNSMDLDFLFSSTYDQYNIIIPGINSVSLPSHIISKPFIELGIMFRKIDLVICHGGNGSIYQALAEGIPVLCSPAHFEQEWNLQALERLGLGERLEENSIEREIQIKRWITSKANSPAKKIAAEIQTLDPCIGFKEALLNVKPSVGKTF